MIIVSLYLTLLVIITQDYNWQSVPYAKWLFPFCNLKFRRNKDVNHEVVLDMILHVIFILSYLWSLVKVVIL
jgi:hypothetical protein